jgi:hypothetical protein
MYYHLVSDLIASVTAHSKIMPLFLYNYNMSYTMIPKYPSHGKSLVRGYEGSPEVEHELFYHEMKTTCRLSV